MSPDDTYREAGRPTKADSLALARALIAQTKASVCTHGVLARDCADHREPAEQPEEPE